MTASSSSIREIEARLRAHYSAELGRWYAEEANQQARRRHEERIRVYCLMFLLGGVIAVAAAVTIVDSVPDTAGAGYYAAAAVSIAIGAAIAVYDRHACRRTDERIQAILVRGHRPALPPGQEQR